MATKTVVAAKKAKVTKKPAKKTQQTWLDKYRTLVRKHRFGKTYALIAVTVLLATSVFWSLLAARLHQSNADQLVNPYMFESGNAFRGALLPGQHSQLLKWPLFMMVQMFDYTNASFIAMTVIITLLTVGLFAALLYYIERRPLMFGTLCLALASVLLLVPANPYSGALLPVNMAMLTTRNIEYIIFLAGMALLARAIHIKTLSFWAGASLLAILVSSDRLFLAISTGGALLALLTYTLSRKWKLARSSVIWLIGSFIGAAGAFIISWAVSHSNLLHIVNSSNLGPYGLYIHARSLALAAIYGTAGLLTNFGANPAFDAVTLRAIPNRGLAHLLSEGGIGYIVNALLLIYGLKLCWQIVGSSLTPARSKEPGIDNPLRLSIMLIWSSIAAIGLFVATNHYYAVDSRYLSLITFTIFVAAATYLRRKSWPAENIVLIGLGLIIITLLSTVLTLHISQDQRQAFSSTEARDALVAQALDRRPVDVLVGDYWRVFPTKQLANGKLKVLPLENCTMARQVLSSTDWQPDLRSHSFAYLLSIDKGLTDFPACSLEQITSKYGRPNSSVLIAGTLDKPSELLLFYDNGIQTGISSKGESATITPIPLEELPFSVCQGPAILNIVAHEDDDLLFMNPDLERDYRAGYCIRTVYITAGDAGSGQFYWLGREKGSESAYSLMAGSSDEWIQRTVKLPDSQFITVTNPRANPRLTLVFMHLPDGNLDGNGFAATNNESLARLEREDINTMRSVDGQSSYTSSQLTGALLSLMTLYKPVEIRTQANFTDSPYADHSDHMAVGRLVKRAHEKYQAQLPNGRLPVPLKFYIGYPIHQMEENVTGQDLTDKVAMFLQYAKFDGGVCQTSEQCNQNPAYSAYLRRQYQNPE